MKYLMTIVLIVLSVSSYCQNDKNNLLRTNYYKCHQNNTSISLPVDFFGPKYFYYEEGSIIDFCTSDTCVVSILCGGNAELSLDSSYHVTDSIALVQGKLRINYFSKTLNRFARRDYLHEYLIMYDRASILRKNELDSIFDELETKQ